MGSANYLHEVLANFYANFYKVNNCTPVLRTKFRSDPECFAGSGSAQGSVLALFYTHLERNILLEGFIKRYVIKSLFTLLHEFKL